MPKEQFLFMIFDIKVTPEGPKFLESGAALTSNLDRYNQINKKDICKEFFENFERDRTEMSILSTDKMFSGQASNMDKHWIIQGSTDTGNEYCDHIMRVDEYFRSHPDCKNKVVDGYATYYYTDKAAFYEICHQNGIPYPRTALISVLDLPGYHIEKGRFPHGIICKSVHASCANGMMFFSSEEDFEQALKNITSQSDLSSITPQRDISSKSARERKMEMAFNKFWKKAELSSVMAVQEYCPGTPIEVGGKAYDPTVRIIAMVSISNGGEAKLCKYDAFCKFPINALGEVRNTENSCSSVGASMVGYPHLNEIHLPKNYRKIVFSEECKQYVTTLAKAFAKTSPRMLWQSLPAAHPMRSYFIQIAERLTIASLEGAAINELSDLLKKAHIKLDFKFIWSVLVLLKHHFFALVDLKLPSALKPKVDLRLFGIAAYLARHPDNNTKLLFLDIALQAVERCYQQGESLKKPIPLRYHYLLMLAYQNISEKNKSAVSVRIASKLDRFGFKLSNPVDPKFKRICIGLFAYFGHFHNESFAIPAVPAAVAKSISK